MERNLWDESREASLFVKEVIEKIDDYKLFPEESFQKIIQGIIATSEIDTQGEALTFEDLQHITEQTNKGIKWMGAEHNPLIHTIGRVISVKLFYAPKSQVYFIGALIGYYDASKLPNFQKLGIEVKRLDSKDISRFQVEDSEYSIKLAFNKHEINPEIIEKLLSEAPPYIDKRPIKSVRKAADPIVILSLMISLNFILGPFFKEYFGTLGRKAAESTISFLKWIKEKLTKENYNLIKKKIIYNFIVPYEECLIEFAIEKMDKELSDEAIDSLPVAIRSALSLVDKMRQFEIQRLVYEYDDDQKCWLPLHAITKKVGVIAEKPLTIDLNKYRGFSIGAQVFPDKSNSEEE